MTHKASILLLSGSLCHQPSLDTHLFTISSLLITSTCQHSSAPLYLHTLHTPSSSGLLFTTLNCTRLPCATNLFLLTFQFPDDSPVLLQRISHVASSRFRTPKLQLSCKEIDCQLSARHSKDWFQYFHSPAIALHDHPSPIVQ